MTPRPEDEGRDGQQLTPNPSSSGNANQAAAGGSTANDDAVTRIVAKPGMPAYVHCESQQDFVNPFPDSQWPAQVKNERFLNLNLGQSVLTPEQCPRLLWMIRFLNNLCVAWWEKYFFAFWKRVPLTWRRNLTHWAWKVYFPVHKALLGRSTGLHPDASPEYHALTTIMWGGRLFPVTVPRMRFSLSQLHVMAPTPVLSTIRTVYDDCFQENKALIDHIPERQLEHCIVRGLFLDTADEPTEYCIFWIYGGAFMSGDPLGNSGPADQIGRACHMDVFIPEFRLVPEAKADDIVWDVCLAYRWLCQRRDASKIIFVGISSGAALCLMVMQNLAKQAREEVEALLPPFVQPAIQGLSMPAAGVLFGPFVDFTHPSGTLWQYQKHDLLVNQRVLEVGLPFLETHVPDGERRLYSPIYQSCRGLPPLCITVSEHETTFDMTMALVNRARRDGVSVSVGVWRYMCHVFSFFNAFVPEGQQSIDFTIEWIKQQTCNET